MDLKLQPKPEVEILPADRGIVSRKEFFVKKKFEEINQYFFAGHFVRDWKPKAELIYPQLRDEETIQYEYDFNREVQNCFVEDFAEEVFLRTPPPCFVVFGKFKREVNKLCEKLSNEYGSVLIQVDDIVNQVIKGNTETGKLVDKILRLGVSLTLNFLLALVSYVAHTPEARHRGYVLSGLPCLPLSCDLSVEQQFHYLFTWDNKPTFFINVLFNDEDLIKKRTNLRVILRGEGRNKYFQFYSVYQSISDDDEESDVDDEMLPINENPPPIEPDIDISPSRPWAQLPGDEESRVWCEFEKFDNIIRPAIKLIMTRVDPQYFMTLDARVPNEFEVVQARLRLLQVWKAPVATPFLLPIQKSEISGGDEERPEEEEEGDPNDDDYLIRQVSDRPPQAGFLTLFSKKTPSPKFRWELSHYNYICPVTLREGAIVEGKTKFAVGFMKYIYFLRDQQCMAKFLKNPRAYVLPVRPKPLCRFIIIGYPYSGKTSLAEALATEFSIPLIDVNEILEKDLLRKKETYQEFCREKAECREVTRLTAQAWQDWRMEEERRINLIEEWIIYIETLLRRRIEQFYSGGEVDEVPGKISSLREIHSVENTENIQVERYGSTKSGESGRRREEEKESLDVRGTPIYVSRPSAEQNTSTPSKILIQAMRHADFDFNKNGLEVEANLVFSSLWNSFSGATRNMEEVRHSEEEFGEFGGETLEFKEDEYEEVNSVNWCSLLPPQSLSSFLMNNKRYTTREKRQSFKIFLEAASKVYREPSALKSEFAKWRLPCFMDIPLCEMFLHNPILLLRYIPDWLKERPLIPDPIDVMHPSVLEASRTALVRAQVVNIKQSKEEIGILLRHAIEKAEREAMRVTGEVISPGGWVVDNMDLDVRVWNKLACEYAFPDHVYILIDTEPDYRRILNIWWEQYGAECSKEPFCESRKSTPEGGKRKEANKSRKSSLTTENRKSSAIHTMDSDTSTSSSASNTSVEMIKLLIENVRAIQEGNAELDAHYRSLLEEKKSLPQYFFPIFSSGGQSSDNGNDGRINNLNMEDSTGEDVGLIQSLSDTFISTTCLLSSPKSYPSLWDIPLGTPLETVTSKFINFLKKKPKDGAKEPNNWTAKCGLEFLYFLIRLPKKLEQIKDWLVNLNRGITITEIEITGKDPKTMILDIKKDLMEPFIKKPRELENFEIEEIKKASVKEILKGEEGFEDEVLESGEDVRIFGESGSLCIVNLERGIFLLGKLEYALRYYGKLYYFWNEDAKNKFIENPEKYAPYYSAIRCYPPLRIFVTGPVGSGKTTLAKSLSHQCGIPNVCYPTLLFNNLVPHFNYEKLSLLTDQKLLLSENHNEEAKKAKEMFLNAPPEHRQFWIESPIHLNFLDQETVLQSIMQVQQPVVVTNYPELIYLCVESVSRNLEAEEDSQLSKTALPLPQAPYASMKEIETIIINYLKEDNDLNNYCIEKSLKTLWTEEPYITQGFVLEDFPKRSYDVKTITENYWIPDLVLELVVPENEVIERNIDNLMELWMTKLKGEIVEEKLLEDAVTNIYNTWKKIKKDKLVSKKREEAMKKLENMDFMKNYERSSFLSVKKSGDVLQGKMPHKSVLKNMGFSEHQLTADIYNLPESVSASIDAEISEILNKEMPHLVFNPIFETYDAAKARIIGNIIKAYRKDCETIEKIKTTLKEGGVSWLEIDGLNDLNETLMDLFIKLNEIRKRLMYKGEFAFTMTMEMAEKLLQQGYYFLSKFGRWCPVQVYRMKNPIHMFRPFSSRGKVTPIAYRSYIYFVAGENEKTQFLEDPIKYTFNEPHHPNIPLRIAVIGPPKSGKTTLCTRLGMMFDLKVITMGSALRYTLETTSATTLARSIKNFLKRGCFLPLSLKMEALMICLSDPSCYTQGFILDGIPFDAALTQSLAEKGKLPFVIISLVADSTFGKTNRERLDLKQFRLPYKNRTNLDKSYQDWKDTYKRFAQWNQNTYNNLYEVNAKLSVVDIFYQAYDIIRKSFFAILYYVEYCVSGRVLPLQYLCVSQHEYELRRSSFHNNCPVCWVEEKKLVCSTDPPSRSGLVQYGKHFYWVCPKDMQKFIENPKIYFLPYATKWPDLLPKRLKKSAAEADPKLKIHGQGRCPVTRVDFPSYLNWEGSWNFAVCYADEVFLCKNEEMLNRFLARPWRYYKADTHYELDQRPNKSNAVENLGPPKMTSLPPIGFLEQTVADLIHDCLQLLGSVRPIYPDMSPSVTGCIFVALYLKVHNKRNKSPHLERHYLNYMIRSCKAFNFEVSCIRPTEKQIGHSDSKMNGSNESDISVVSGTSKCSVSDARSCYDFTDFAKTEKKIWSAKKISDKYTEMKLTLNDELQEIPVHPKEITVLQYESQRLRINPIPPISHCLTFIYSIKPALKVPDKFNYNTLYQPIQFCSTALSSKIVYNPDKKFSIPLYMQKSPSYPSELNVYKGHRVLSDITIGESRQISDTDPEYMMKRFIPRFKLLDKLIPSNLPSVLQVIPDTALVYNPHRDYAYTMLLSEFFCTTHVLRSYESIEERGYLEFSNRLDSTLGLTRTQVEYMNKPRVKPSEISRTSLDSYQQIFDAASLFVVGAVESDMSITSGRTRTSVESSIYDFIQTLFSEKLDQLFEQLCNSNISYDTFDIITAPMSGKKDISIVEVLPYPPLPWDITCRPYHAYRSISSIFKKPTLENIAHERQFSLLDGIIELNEGFRYLQIQGNTRDAQEEQRFLALRNGEQPVKQPVRKRSYFIFDFFNIPWSSFLTYTYSGAFYREAVRFEEK